MTTLNEKSTLPLSMIFTLLGGAFTIGSAIIGVWFMQDKRSGSIENSLAFVARDVADIKAQVTEVKSAMRDQVTVAEMESWIRLNNATDPNHPLQRFRN